MYMNYDEMDIEPNSEPFMARNASPPPEVTKIDPNVELQEELLKKTVTLDNGRMGFVYSRVGKDGEDTSAFWRCHVCDYGDTWDNLIRHMETKYHRENLNNKPNHPHSNFSRIDTVVTDLLKDQPVPPGMEEEDESPINEPCEILKTLKNFNEPVIGLEYLIEMDLPDFKEPRYLCLLCDKRGDPRSVLKHLTSINHYVIYLRKYFHRLYIQYDKLPKNIEKKGKVVAVVTHLIGKIEEKYGRLQPFRTTDDVCNQSTADRSLLVKKLDNLMHFAQKPEDSFLEQILSNEYVSDPSLLKKHFPLKSNKSNEDADAENVDKKNLFNNGSKFSEKKKLRERTPDHKSDSPDVIFVNEQPVKPDRYNKERSRGEISPYRSRRRSRSRSGPDYRVGGLKHRQRRSSRSRSPGSLRRDRSRSPVSLRRDRSRSPGSLRRDRSRSPGSLRRDRSRSPHGDRRLHRSPPRGARYGRRSPDRRYEQLSRHGRSRSPERRSGMSPDTRRFRRSSRSRSPARKDRIFDRERDRRIGHRISPSRSSSISNSMPGKRFNSSKVKTHISRDERMEAVKAYTNELEIIEKELTREHDKNLENPEDHPTYQEEWKNFWCARFKELTDEGKVDPQTYDYKPEWIIHWNKKIKILYDTELEKHKVLLKKKFDVNDDILAQVKIGIAESEVSSNNESTVKPVEENVPIAETKRNGAEKKEKPVVDIKTMWKEMTGFEIRDTPASKDLSTWEVDNENENGESKKSSNTLDNCTMPISPDPLSSISDSDSDHKSPDRRFRQRPRSRYSKSPRRRRSRSRSTSYSRDEYSHKKSSSSASSSKRIHFDNNLNIITVLRQLSVLEFQLGAHANHIVSLLTSGLAMERNKPNSSNELLTKENIIFLELVKEKLKGQLVAGLVPKTMVKATLFCIKNVEELLDRSPKIDTVPAIPNPPPGLLYGGASGPAVMRARLPPPHLGMSPFPPRVYGGAFAHPNPTFRNGPSLTPFEIDVLREREREERFRDIREREGRLLRDEREREDRFREGRERGDRIKEEREKEEKFKVERDRFPFRRSPSPIVASNNAERFESMSGSATTVRNQREYEEQMKQKVSTMSKPNEAIDEKLIAIQIAEVLTSEGRTDVSEEELNSLINIVVENLKKEQRLKQEGSNALNNVVEPSSDIPELSFAAADVPVIPAGFNVNEVPNSTFALLQDVYQNVSANKSATDLESMSEIEIIKMLCDFKDLPRFRQDQLIEYLRKLEERDPLKVENLKKYVKL